MVSAPAGASNVALEAVAVQRLFPPRTAVGGDDGHIQAPGGVQALGLGHVEAGVGVGVGRPVQGDLQCMMGGSGRTGRRYEGGSMRNDRTCACCWALPMPPRFLLRALGTAQLCLGCALPPPPPPGWRAGGRAGGRAGCWRAHRYPRDLDSAPEAEPWPMGCAAKRGSPSRACRPAHLHRLRHDAGAMRGRLGTAMRQLPGVAQRFWHIGRVAHAVGGAPPVHGGDDAMLQGGGCGAATLLPWPVLCGVNGILHCLACAFRQQPQAVLQAAERLGCKASGKQEERAACAAVQGDSQCQQSAHRVCAGPATALAKAAAACPRPLHAAAACLPGCSDAGPAFSLCCGAVRRALPLPAPCRRWAGTWLLPP